MNEYVWIAVSVISGVFGLMAISLMQHNWFRREDLKYKYDLRRAKARAKGTPVKKSSTPSGVGDWIQLLKGVNPETAHLLIDSFGGSESSEEPEDMVDKIVDMASKNPELVEKFLKGVSPGKTEEEYL